MPQKLLYYHAGDRLFQFRNEISVDVWIFILFCVLHLVLWTAVPFFFSAALPHDVAEAVAWGLQGQWGYDKHPPLNAWLCAFFFRVGGVFAVYCWAQVLVVLSFIAIWKLACECLSRWHSLMAVLLLSGISYFNIDTPNITPDTLQTPLWAWIIYLFYRVLSSKNTLLWIPLGGLMGLAILAKYQALILFACMAIVLMSTEEGRKSLKAFPLYLAALIALIIAAPHVYWLYEHNWIALHYLENSTVGTLHMHNNPFLPRWIFQPLRFLAGVFSASVLLIVFSFLCGLKKPSYTHISVPLFQQRFIAIMAFGPLCLTLLFGLYLGSELIPRWATPYFSLWGIAAMLWLKPDFSREADRKRGLLLCFLLVFIFPIARVSYLIVLPHFSKRMHPDDYFPAQMIASNLEQKWHNQYKTPVPYVIGNHYLAAYFSVYSKDHPKPFMGFDQAQSPWINMADVRQQGAIIVLKAGEHSDSLLREIKINFPTLVFNEIRLFPKVYPFASYAAEPHSSKSGVLLMTFFLPPQADIPS